MNEFTAEELAALVRGDAPSIPTTKRCWRCKQSKPPSAFNKSKTGRYGLDSNCRECSKARWKEKPRRPHVPPELNRRGFRAHPDKRVIPAPVNKVPVLRVLREADRPLFLSEVARLSGVRLVLADGVLSQAVKAGTVTRQKVPRVVHAPPLRGTRDIIPGAGKRLMWLYRWVG